MTKERCLSKGPIDILPFGTTFRVVGDHGSVDVAAGENVTFHFPNDVDLRIMVLKREEVV